MTHRKLTARERKVKALLLSGCSRNAIASKVSISKSTVYDIVDRLVYYGEIREIPGTRNPKIYEDANPDPIIPLKGDEEPEIRKCGEGAQNRGGGGDSKAQLPDIDLPGISTDKYCPEGYVEAHLNGNIFFTELRAVGTFDDIRDARGFVQGFWYSEPSRLNGSIQYKGELRILNQVITFTYRVGDKGSKTFRLYPARIFLDPLQFESQEEASAVFIDRALYVASILRRTGWDLAKPEFCLNGRGFEYAIKGCPLVAHLPKGTNVPESDIFVDTSDEVPEIEMREVSDWEKLQIFANLPTEIQTAKARLSSVESSASEAHSKIETASKVIVSHQTRLDDMDSILSRMIGIQEKQTTALVNIGEHTNLIIAAQNNINAAIAAGTQRQLDSFDTVRTAGDPPADNPNDSDKPTRLEGYI